MATSSPSRTESDPKINGEASSASSPKKEQDSSPAATPSLPKRTWKKLGLSGHMLMTMLKGACPPVIALALYQSEPFATHFSTLGYLVGIMSVLSLPILPRSKFFQTMVFNVLGVCIGAAIALLTVYCSVQARTHTTPVSTKASDGPAPGAPTYTYNSSASAVCAIWLFASIFVSNSLRFSRPQLQLPVIIYSIFANVSSTYAPQFATMAQGIAFVERLLEAFLAGFAIASGVNLFVFPQSSRDVVFQEASGYIVAIQGVLKAQNGYLRSLEKKEMFRPSPKDDNKAVPEEVFAAKSFENAIAGLLALHGKMQGDLTSAKREVAYSHLCPKELDELFQKLREILLPLIGMGSVVDIFNRIAQDRDWKAEESLDIGEKSDQTAKKLADHERKENERSQWNEVMKTLQEPFEVMSAAMIEGLNHTSYALRFSKAPKAKSPDDLEANEGEARPGDDNYGKTLAKKVKLFYEQREVTLQTWCNQRGIKMSHVTGGTDGEAILDDPAGNHTNQRQLYLILYMDFLLWSTGKAVVDLVQYVDTKVAAGVMRRRKLVLPGKKRLRKWIMTSLNAHEGSNDLAPDNAEVGVANISLGASFQKQKNPEHLPPTNAWQQFGDTIHSIPRFMASPEAGFGFRVACGTLSIGIVAFLEVSQKFFTEQRLVWAMIMVAIGMTMTAGSGVFGFIGKVVGTFIAACTSLIMWYVAGGTGVPAGVLVLLYFFIFVELYFMLAYPKYTITVLLSILTQILILGYELQVKKIGIAAAEATGQVYYPLYLLAPYRLATVAGGCAVAFFWTFFPYPITARSTLRRQLGESLYLLANYYSCVHTTIRMRVEGTGGDREDKMSPCRRLEKARDQILAKELALFAQLRLNSASTTFEPKFGGKFPKGQYDTIIKETQNILNYMTLIAYATRTYDKDVQPLGERKWANDFGRVLRSIHVTTEEVTSLISLLSASVTNSSPLPPYLKAPSSYQLSLKMREIDPDILSINHITEPGYAAFAVTQVASTLINDDLDKLLTNIKDLVGETDFNFHIISSLDSSEQSLPLDQGKSKPD
ncbi:hypothetical protein MMC11_004813 [Xylographa trunciseda]|nr:hypothetical protein [Xylographa trunciseda]